MLEAVSAQDVVEHLPMTRYRGSKRRFAPSIAFEILASQPIRVVDPFGGSATVSAIADAMGINSSYNDLQLWSARCARALLLHDYTPQELAEAHTLVRDAMKNAREGFISRTFAGIYFTKAENLELDGLLCLQSADLDQATLDLCFYGTCQSALMKMPMSMFHRASLPQRLADVNRKSGNITTWNKPFHALVPRCMQEAVSFTHRRRATHTISQTDAVASYQIAKSGDMLFLDPPYVNPRGGVPSYDQAYHFLEGFAHGEIEWTNRLVKSGQMPFFQSMKSSAFECKSGWKQGMEVLVSRGSKHGVLGTARIKDTPGAKELGEMLAERFTEVRSSTLQAGVIFSKNPNPEILFSAQA